MKSISATVPLTRRPTISDSRPVAVTAVVLFFVMALFGVQVVGAIGMPLVGGIVTLVTRRPLIWWRIGGTAYKFIVGGATYAIGIAVGLSWWVALIVAF